MKYKLSVIFLFVLIALSSGQAHARWLQAQQGRFIQRDPIYYNDGVNLYGYVDNMPSYYSDPFGLSKKHPRKKLPKPKPGKWKSIKPLESKCKWCEGSEDTYGSANYLKEKDCCCSCEKRDIMMYSDEEWYYRPGFAHDLEKAGTVFGVNNTEHLINTLGANIKSCQCVNKLTINAHGGYYGEGGFRFEGYDDPETGHADPEETISESNAIAFAKAIKGVMCKPCIINVMACSSADGATLAKIAAETGCSVRGTKGLFERRQGNLWGLLNLWTVKGDVVDVTPEGTETVIHKKGTGGSEVW